MNVCSTLDTFEYAICGIQEEVRNYRNLTFWITLQCFSFSKKEIHNADNDFLGYSCPSWMV